MAVAINVADPLLACFKIVFDCLDTILEFSNDLRT